MKNNDCHAFQIPPDLKLQPGVEVDYSRLFTIYDFCDWWVPIYFDMEWVEKSAAVQQLQNWVMMTSKLNRTINLDAKWDQKMSIWAIGLEWGVTEESETGREL